VIRTVILALALLVAGRAFALDALTEVRRCGPPPRTASGEIKRRSDVLTAFKKLYACPSTGLHTGSCPDWSIDHTLPLALGGCDAVFNLQWLPNAIKSCAGTACKDRWERKVYAP
jgi:hypothetical protein